MNVHYCVNGVPGVLPLPSSFLENARAEDLAELAAADHWRRHPMENASHTTLVHLQDLDGNELGIFEVERVLRPVYTARHLTPA